MKNQNEKMMDLLKLMELKADEATNETMKAMEDALVWGRGYLVITPEAGIKYLDPSCVNTLGPWAKDEEW